MAEGSSFEFPAVLWHCHLYDKIAVEKSLATYPKGSALRTLDADGGFVVSARSPKLIDSV